MFILLVLALIVLAAVVAPRLGKDSRDLDARSAPHAYTGLSDNSF
jgi:hypothetical protein